MDPIWLEVTVETTEPELETLAARLNGDPAREGKTSSED